jgi:hypothetical protein
MVKREGKSQEEYLERRRIIYADNAERVKALAYAWAKANPEKVKAAKRKFNSKPESKAARNKRERQAYAEDIEAGRAKKRSEYAANRETIREQAKAWRKSHPENNRAHNLARHGLTIDDYDRILAYQNGRCAICLCSTPGGRWNVFYVDHDHSNGKVRGLLCSICNTMIGQAKDSTTRLRSAVRYLERHGVMSTEHETLPLFAQAKA